MAAFQFRRRQTRRWWYAGATLMAVAFFAVFFVVGATADNPSGCDFAATGTTESCSAPLSGSTFAGGDGNLSTSPTAFGTTDWQNVSGRNGGLDLASGSTDNSFGQGTKEDNASVTVVTGSIPPQKSDLTRFYEASEFANGSNFLYLAWERTNNLGSANMDFEINQQTQPDLTTTGAKTLNRTAGDLLVTFDFTNGGGKPTLGLLTWLTAAHSDSASDCFSSNSLPCWGKQKTLNAAISEGAVNNLSTVTDPIGPNAPRNLGPLTFGEAAINLTTAGVFPANTCEAFGSVFLKSRSSSSFPAEVKDFVAPVPVNISNCGTIIVRKVAQNGNSTFGYSTTGGLTPSTFTLTGGSSRTYGPGTVLPGNYTVNEPTEPSGWTFVSLDCSATTGNGTTASQDGTSTTADITIAPGGVADCTYTNRTKLSPTIATTLSGTTINIGDSVHDSATLSGATANAGGTVTYSAYAGANNCTGTDLLNSTKTVTNGTVPDSASISFTAAGSYSFQAVYSGDANNNGATSVCSTEQLLVKTNPSITTTLSSSSVNVGSTVHDSATLSGATGDAGGTVTYTVYSNNTCSAGARDAGTVTVTNGGVPDSNALAFNTAGTFYWQAVYTGDTKNNGATSACTSETLVVNPLQPSASTAQNLIPNDSFTLSGGFSPTGTITFKLFSPSDATCSGTPALSQTVNVSGNGTYPTTNSTFIASAVGTWRWKSVYSGDGNNLGVTSSCGVENFTITNS